MLIIDKDKIEKLKKLNKELDLKLKEKKEVNLSGLKKIFADINDTDENGSTLLHLAVKFGLNALVHALLENEENLEDEEKMISSVDKKGNTPLHLAAKWYSQTAMDEYYNIICTLKDFRPDVTCRNKKGQAPWELLKNIEKTELYYDFMIMLLRDPYKREDVGPDNFGQFLDHFGQAIVENDGFIKGFVYEIAREDAYEFLEVLLEKKIIARDFITTVKIKDYDDSSEEEGLTALAWAVKNYNTEYYSHFIEHLWELDIIAKEDFKIKSGDKTMFELNLCLASESELVTIDQEYFLKTLLHINYNWFFMKNDSGVNLLESKKSFWERNFNDFIKRMIKSILLYAEFGSFEEKIAFLNQCRVEFPKIHVEWETLFNENLRLVDASKLVTVDQEKFLEYLLDINYNWFFMKNDSGVNLLESKKSFWEGNFNDFIKRMIESILINAGFGSLEENTAFVKQCKAEFPQIYAEWESFENYARLELHCQAYDFAFSIIANQLASKEAKDQARLNIADLIFQGKILLKGFPANITASGNEQNTAEFDKLDENEKHNITSHRVIQAYHYLCNNSLPNAAQLRGIFDAILSGDFSGQQNDQPWLFQALEAFEEYYRNIYNNDDYPRELLTILIKQQDSQLNQMKEKKLLAVQQETKEGAARTLKREYDSSTVMMTEHAKRTKMSNLNASQYPPQQP